MQRSRTPTRTGPCRSYSSRSSPPATARVLIRKSSICRASRRMLSGIWLCSAAKTPQSARACATHRICGGASPKPPSAPRRSPIQGAPAASTSVNVASRRCPRPTGRAQVHKSCRASCELRRLSQSPAACGLEVVDPRRRKQRPYARSVLIDIVVYDGLDEMDALGPLEVLRSASKQADVSVRLVTREAQQIVTGACGLSFLPDAVYQPGEAHVLLVPGGGWAARADRGAWGEGARGGWLPLLRQARSTVGILAGVCTGTMLLAHAGVVGNRRASTHRSAWDDLEATGATLVRERVVDDGDLVASGGVTSGIDLALWLVERELSPPLAEQIATRMEYPRQRPS